MPYGLPSATVTNKEAKALSAKGLATHLPEGYKLEILRYGADQDGYDGHVICRDLSEQEWAVMPEDLRV